MKRGEGSTATAMSESKGGPTLTVVELPPHREEVDSKLEQARDHLLALRRQQEELERQKNELEELRRRQEEYSRGRAEITDKLARGLVAIERQQVESQRLAELCESTIIAFREYTEQIEQINDEEWKSANVRDELSRALATIESARLEYNRAHAKLDCLNPADGQTVADLPTDQKRKLPAWDELVRYACIGAAASAPLIVAGTIWLIVLMTAKH
jgi:DNA repair exonuclease SbcCD ATPase subunit